MKKTVTAACVAAALGLAAPARADLALNATGIADGFVLSKFSTGTITSYYDNIDTAALPDGTVVASGYNTGFLYKYPDVDGQTTGSSISSVAVSGPGPVTSVGGQAYVGLFGSGYYQVSNSLGLTALPGAAGSLLPNFGLWGNQVSGKLIASTTGGIYEIDPTTGATRFIVANPSGPDGLSVSPDGTTLYIESNGNEVYGYRISDGALVYDSGILSGNPDGTGVIGGGPLAGDIVVNNNDGTLGLLDPAGGGETIIATGGVRGDITGLDTNNGTLFVSDSAAMYRLGLASGSFSDVPEPASMALLGGALVGLGWVRRRRA